MKKETKHFLNIFLKITRKKNIKKLPKFLFIVQMKFQITYTKLKIIAFLFIKYSPSNK